MPQHEKASPESWIENYADSLFGYAFVRVNDREVAKDLVQDTFVSALQNISSFRGDSSEKTWLTSILKNKIIDHYRKAATNKTVTFSDFDDSSELDSYFGADGEWKESTKPADWKESHRDDFRLKEFHETLQRCLTKLTAQSREVFSLKYIDELEADEICKELTISPSNYWVVMHRAKLALRRCIEKNWIQA